MSPSDQKAPPGNQVVLDHREKARGRRYFWISGTPIFTPVQLEALRNLVDSDNQPALVEGAGEDQQRDDVRRTRIHWLNFSEHRWVYEIVWATAQKANALFEFDVIPMYDIIQLARYDSEEQGFFRWHTDIVPSDLSRKISITVPLNDADEYEGGELELNSGSLQRPPQIAGAPIMFPSWILHRVAPVTSGRRYSLVAWVRGPGWR